MFCGAFRMAATVLSILATPSMVSVSVPCAAHASDAGRGDRASRQKTGEKFAPVETSAIKTVAAFLNSYDGGSQLLGVAEDGGGRGVPFGLELDYLTVRKPDNGDGDMFGPNTTAPRMRRPASPQRSGNSSPTANRNADFVDLIGDVPGDDPDDLVTALSRGGLTRFAKQAGAAIRHRRS